MSCSLGFFFGAGRFLSLALLVVARVEERKVYVHSSTKEKTSANITIHVSLFPSRSPSLPLSISLRRHQCFRSCRSKAPVERGCVWILSGMSLAAVFSAAATRRHIPLSSLERQLATAGQSLLRRFPHHPCLHRHQLRHRHQIHLLRRCHRLVVIAQAVSTEEMCPIRKHRACWQMRLRMHRCPRQEQQVHSHPNSNSNSSP